MYTRRRFLATTATTTGAVALPGCGFLGGGSAAAGRRWLTEEVGTIPAVHGSSEEGSATLEGPRFAEVEVLDPGRAHESQLENDRLNGLHYGFLGEMRGFAFPEDQVDQILWAFAPEVGAAVGSFEASVATDQLPEYVDRRREYDGAELHTGENPRFDVHEGFAAGDGTFVAAYVQPTRDAAIASLEVLLDAANGEGSSVADEGVLGRVTGFLERGLYTFYNAPGNGTGGGISLRIEGDTVHRRSILVYPGDAAASESRLLDDSTIETYRSPYRRWDAFTSVDVSRDGRAVTVEATLPVDELGFGAFSLP